MEITSRRSRDTRPANGLMSNSPRARSRVVVRFSFHPLKKRSSHGTSCSSRSRSVSNAPMGPDTEYTRPLTRVCDAADELAGSTIPDPYRWLEDDSEETRQWQAEQAALAAGYVRDKGQLDAVRESVL